MKQYTIYCTKEQTERAYNLGAPIMFNECIDKTRDDERFFTKVIPTAEQMCGWLRDKKQIFIAVYEHHKGFDFDSNFDERGEYTFYDTYKQAMHASIDAALDYLEKGE